MKWAIQPFDERNARARCKRFMHHHKTHGTQYTNIQKQELLAIGGVSSGSPIYSAIFVFAILAALHIILCMHQIWLHGLVHDHVAMLHCVSGTTTIRAGEGVRQAAKY